MIKVLMKANWISSKGLCELWNKLGDGNYSYTKNEKTIKMVWEPPYDYVIVINSTDDSVPLDKTIYLVMEPKIYHPRWNFYLHNPSLLKAIWCHKPGNYNNNEWHISKTRQELLTFIPKKTEGNTISAILSDKYNDDGHILRINLALKAQHRLEWHSYGGNAFRWKNYKGILPMYCKDDGLFPYKYTFNSENTFLPGYYTEKLIDSILSECLCFYMGPPNIEELIDPKAYINLDMKNIEESIDIMKQAIAENQYSQRLKYIKQAKYKILTETGFFPRLHKLLFTDD